MIRRATANPGCVLACLALLGCGGDPVGSSLDDDGAAVRDSSAGGTTGEGSAAGSGADEVDSAAVDSAADSGDPEGVDPVPESESVPDGPAGVSDAFAQLGCDLLEGRGTAVIAVDSEADAGQVLLLPSETESYLISLPEGGPGYLTMEVPEWAAEISIYVEESTRYQVLGAEVQLLTELAPNPLCAERGITHRSHHFHSWGAFTIAFEAEGPREAQVALVLTDPGG